MTYPNTTLPGAQDPDFGGQPPSQFGVPAFQWINSVLQFLASAFLQYVYVPYTTEVYVASASANAGDVAAIDLGAVAPGGAYTVAKYSASMNYPVIVGIFILSVSLGDEASIATSGVIPSTITGLAAANGLVGVNQSTGRARIAQAGDPLIGSVDPQGNLYISLLGGGIVGAFVPLSTAGGANYYQLNSPGGSLYLGQMGSSAVARLQVDSTTQGVLFPRMTTTQKNAISTPPDGLVVYDTTLHKLCHYSSGAAAWLTVTSA